MPMTPQGFARTFPAPGSGVTLPMSPTMMAQNSPNMQPDAAQAAGGAGVGDVQAAAAEMGAPTPPELAGAPGDAQGEPMAAQADGAMPAPPAWQPGATGQPTYPPGEGPVTSQVPKLAGVGSFAVKRVGLPAGILLSRAIRGTLSTEQKKQLAQGAGLVGSAALGVGAAYGGKKLYDAATKDDEKEEKSAMLWCDGRALLGVESANCRANSANLQLGDALTTEDSDEKRSYRTLIEPNHHTQSMCCSTPISVSLFNIIEKCGANAERFQQEGIDTTELLQDLGRKLGEVLNTGEGKLQRSAVGESGLKIGVRPYAVYGEAAWPAARSKSGRPVQEDPPEITTIGEKKAFNADSFKAIPALAKQHLSPKPSSSPSLSQKMLANAGRMSSGILNSASGLVGGVGLGVMRGANAVGSAMGNANAKARAPILKDLYNTTKAHTSAGLKDIGKSFTDPGSAASKPTATQESFHEVRNRPGVTDNARNLSEMAETIGEGSWGAAQLATGLKAPADPGVIRAATAANKLPGVAKATAPVGKAIDGVKGLVGKLPGMGTKYGPAAYDAAAMSPAAAPIVSDTADIGSQMYDPEGYDAAAYLAPLQALPPEQIEYLKSLEDSVLDYFIEKWHTDPEGASQELQQRMSASSSSEKAGAVAAPVAGNALKPKAPVAPKAPKANVPLQSPKPDIQAPTKGLVNPTASTPASSPKPKVELNTGPKQVPGQPVTSQGNKPINTPGLLGQKGLSKSIETIQQEDARQAQNSEASIAKARANNAAASKRFTNSLPQQINEGTAPHQVKGQSPQSVALAKDVAKGLRGKYLSAEPTYNTGTGFGARRALGPNAGIQAKIDAQKARKQQNAGWESTRGTDIPLPEDHPGVTDVQVTRQDIDQGRAPAKTQAGFLARKARAMKSHPSRIAHMKAQKEYIANRNAGRPGQDPGAYRGGGPTWEEYSNPYPETPQVADATPDVQDKWPGEGDNPNALPAEPRQVQTSVEPESTNMPVPDIAAPPKPPEPKATSRSLMPDNLADLNLRTPGAAADEVTSPGAFGHLRSDAPYKAPPRTNRLGGRATPKETAEDKQKAIEDFQKTWLDKPSPALRNAMADGLSPGGSPKAYGPRTFGSGGQAGGSPKAEVSNAEPTPMTVADYDRQVKAWTDAEVAAGRMHPNQANRLATRQQGMGLQRMGDLAGAQKYKEMSNMQEPQPEAPAAPADIPNTEPSLTTPDSQEQQDPMSDLTLPSEETTPLAPIGEGVPTGALSPILGENPAAAAMPPAEVAQVEQEGPGFFASAWNTVKEHAMSMAVGGPIGATLYPITKAMDAMAASGSMDGVKAAVMDPLVNSTILSQINGPKFKPIMDAAGIDPAAIKSVDDLGKALAGKVSEGKARQKAIANVFGMKLDTPEQQAAFESKMKAIQENPMEAINSFVRPDQLKMFSEQSGVEIKTPQDITKAIDAMQASLSPMGMIQGMLSKLGMGNMTGTQQIMMLMTGGGLLMGLFGMLMGSKGLAGAGAAMGALGGAGTFASGALGGTDYLSGLPGLMGMNPQQQSAAPAAAPATTASDGSATRRAPVS